MSLQLYGQHGKIPAAPAIELLHERDPENFPDTGAGCADRRYLIRSEAEGDDIELRAGSIEGLPSVYITEESDVAEDVLIVVDGMQAPGNYPALRAGTVYTIFKVIGDLEAEVAFIHCKALLKDKGSRQHYVVSVGRAYLPKVQILEAWREGVPVSWRDLDPVYGYPWISACMSLASPFNWRQTLVTGLVVLDVAGLRTEDDFYHSLLRKQRRHIRKRLEFQRIARRVEEEHGRLLAHFALEAHVRLDDEIGCRPPAACPRRPAIAPSRAPRRSGGPARRRRRPCWCGGGQFPRARGARRSDDRRN
jgi:hypothetical protein